MQKNENWQQQKLSRKLKKTRAEFPLTAIDFSYGFLVWPRNKTKNWEKKLARNRDSPEYKQRNGYENTSKQQQKGKKGEKIFPYSGHS